MTGCGVSQALADFVVRSDWDGLPPEVRHQAKRSLLNFFAVAFAGCRDPAVDVALSVLSDFAGDGAATIIGRPERSDALTASFLNAVAANVQDFDDTHIRTVIHPTAPVAPGLLALSERQRLTGRELLHALALGMEAACRIGNAVSPGHYRRGWHITATCGIFGAALAAGKALGLDREGLVAALGNASAQSSGLVETLGFMAKSAGVGNAARNGLLSALLAQRGFGGSPRPLEGPYGFFAVMSDAANLAEVTEGLGSRWEMLDNIHKPYPCGIVLNAVIDGCLRLRPVLGAAPDDLVSVTLHGHPLLGQRADRPDVATGREAQVSAQHAVAICLIHGRAGLPEFSDTAVADPRVRALRRKVRIVDAPDVAVAGVRVVAERADGSQEIVVVDHALGTDRRPLSDVELEDKCRTLAAFGAPDCKEIEALIEGAWTLDDQDDSGALMRLATPAAPRL
jgi:2-methylcitrate dehydratase PrpD